MCSGENADLEVALIKIINIVALRSPRLPIARRDAAASPA